jgi:2-polyprenyl-3-methyl-5-hydroxy-6-metoxy-1,4-benzoquinol methylase
MASLRLLFRVFYGLGFIPWDGHSLSPMLRELVEGTDPLSPGSALDVGCGTGDASIYLAQHGWQVTGVDFTPKALDMARAKARSAEMSVDFVHADVTQLSQAGIEAKFQLITDNGCLHGLSDGDRDLYVREITAAAAPGAHLLIVGAKPGGPVRLLRLDQAEVERRFTPAWTLLSTAEERMTFPDGYAHRHTPITLIGNRFAARYYLLQRQP